MPTSVTKRFNVSTGDFKTEVDVKNYINGLDLIALDQNVTIYVDGTFNLLTGFNMGPLTSDDTHRVTLKGDPATGVNAQQRTIFDAGNTGGALALNRNNSYGAGLNPGMDIQDLRILITGDATHTSGYMYGTGRNSRNTWDNIISRCRIYDNSLAAGAEPIRGGISGAKMCFTDNLFVLDSAAGKTIMSDGGSALIARNTFVALGSAIGAATAVNDVYGGQTIRNNVFIGFSKVFNTNLSATSAYNNYANVAPTSGRTATAGILTVATGLVVNTATDYRPANNSPLLGNASTDAKSTPDILGNNRGTLPDVGAWQLNPAPPLTVATVTSITVNGTTATISGTTTNSPTSATASLIPTATPYNNAVAQANVAIVLSTNAFTVTFTDLKVGVYAPTLTFTNAGGPALATNNQGNVSIVDAVGTITSQAIDGQSLNISGTYTGTPDFGTLYVPASASNPAGANPVGPISLIFDTTAKTFIASVAMSPGNYDAPVVALTTVHGTSLPASGASAFTIIGITGSPEAPAATITVTNPTPVPSTTDINMTIADRVKDNTNTTGTGPFTMNNAPELNYRPLLTAPIVVGAVVPYMAVHRTANEWENGEGTLTSALTLERTRVTASSNNNQLVNFSAGVKDVSVGLTAALMARIPMTDSPVSTSLADPSTTYLIINDNGTPKTIKLADAVIAASSLTSVPLPVVGADVIMLSRNGIDYSAALTDVAAAIKLINGGTADTTAPTAPTSLTSSGVVSVSATLNWVAATDNVAVTAYEVSTDGTTWTNAGNVTSYTFTGLTAATTYTLRVRALDAAGNRSTAATLQVTTAAASDTTAPTMSGSITTSSVTSSTFTMAYSAGSDNVGVSRYEVSTDGGTTWIVNGTNLSYTKTGAAASTLYNLRVRCFDAAGNVSNVLTGTVTTSAAAAAETLTVVTPTAQYTGTAFTVSGTYANGTPTALDYSLDGGTTWTAASTPTISGGNYSFSVTINSANASQTISVRDHDVTTATVTSGTFSVTTATAYTITSYNSNSVKSGTGQAIDVSGQALTGGKKYIFANNLMVSSSSYWNISPTPSGAEWGWSNSPTQAPTNSITLAQNNGSSDNQNGMVPMSHPGAWSNDGYLWITPGSGTTNWYAWCKPAGGVAQCMNPKDGSGNPIATVVTGG